LNYAYRLMNLPLGIFAAAVATVIFPTLAQQAARGESHSLESTLFKGLGMMSLVTVPTAVGMIVLRQPLVALLFQRGAFDYQATVMTAAALLFYSLGLWGWSANMVLTRAYYALGDVKTPVLTGAVSIVLNLVLSLLLLPPLSFGGLALANSLAATANTLLLFGGLTRRLHLAGRSQFYVSLGKITAASAVMGLATSLAARITSRLVPAATSWGQAEVLAAGTVVGIVVFLIAVLLLKVEEAGEVGKIFLPGRRLKEGAIE
jgi:putative peptidoglycan lipid II flippase